MATREFPRMALSEAIDSIDLSDDARIRDSYDGRGAYGRPAFGVVLLTMQDALRLAAALGVIAGAEIDSDDEEDAELANLVNELMRDARTDNMGHDVILYFNGWQLADR